MSTDHKLLLENNLSSDFNALSLEACAEMEHDARGSVDRRTEPSMAGKRLMLKHLI